MDKLNPFQIERKRERGREEKQCDKKILNFVRSLRKKSYNWCYGTLAVFFQKKKILLTFQLAAPFSWPNGEILVNIPKVNILKTSRSLPQLVFIAKIHLTVEFMNKNADFLADIFI